MPGQGPEPGPGPAGEPAVMIRMDSAVEFTSREIGSQTQVFAHHQSIGKFFQLGPEEYRIASLFDGTRTMSDVVAQLELDGMDWEPAEVAELVQRFVSCGIAHAMPVAGAASPTTAAAPKSSPQANKPNVFSQLLPKSLSMIISQRIPLLQGDRIAASLERRVGSIFSTNGICIWILLVASGLMLVFGHHHEFAIELRRMFDPGMWMVLFVIWVVSKVIHELGHAVAAKYHGVRVGKIGIMFFLFAPLAYVDVTDAWKLRSRWSRIQIALGGVYVELAFAAVAAWTWWFLPAGMAKHLAAQFFMISGPATLLVNANPLLRLDGYFVVGDLVEIPNLRMHGRNHCAAWIEKVLVNIPSPRPLLTGWRRTFATVHAVASVAFQIVWMSGLVIGISIWAKGLGIALAIVAAVLWCVFPLTKWVLKVWMYQSDQKRFFTSQRYRLVMLGFFVFSTLPSLSIVHSPMDRRVPVVVRFHDEQIARSATEAFVRKVHVTSGQRVSHGTLLIELDNPELKMKRDQKADDLQLAELRAIQLRRQHQLAMAASELETAESLRRQLDELNQQVRSLSIVAEREGFVIGLGVEQLQGRFVHPGDELLRVADPQEKELLVSVGPSDVEAFGKVTAQKLPGAVRLRGGQSFQATPMTLRPRARTTLPHPALAATVGGPLPVEPSPDDDGQWRVVDPQMESVTPLDPITSLDIHAGQIGTLSITDNRTIASRLYDAMSR
ncbi:putative peptide zinc metalloprotease protein YydH [Rubripirellula reticaptiva]|uniref:Putative peptide zinc metalloprotease protein YydH n=2 Tax=Rubripirellula reticaptiva TaxID=2528013 RepID=A0A5C6EMS7_9BACT|nr:putative peptide zinc metalloprotease protein YydH [Rubripirellula reticaptiva]